MSGLAGRMIAVSAATALVSIVLPAGHAPAVADDGDSGPERGPEVTSSDYPEGHVAGGTIGDTGSFTFSANGVEDAAAYYYGINTGACTTELEPSVQGGDATLEFTPTNDGPHTIKARTVDSQGRSSQCETVYTFMVAPLSHPFALFEFNESEGASAADTLDSGATLEREEPLTWTRGRVGERQRLEGAAVRFDGHGEPLMTREPVIDTEQDFSVSVWARLDGKDRDRKAVAQGEPGNAFELGYRSSSGLDNWVMEVPVRNASGSLDSIQVISTEPAQEGVWTHLLGTVDQSEGTAALYVDGVEQADAGSLPSAAAAQGPLVVGAQGAGDQTAGAWSGAVDDLRIWDRRVYDDGTDDRGDPYTLASDPSLQGRWMLDETEGSVAADSSDRGLDGLLDGDPDPVWGGEMNDGTFSDAAAFSGVERITVGEPVVRTDRSFSVAAWARPDDTGNAASVVSQRDASGTGMRLGMAPVDGRMRWVVSIQDGDTVTTAYSEGAPLQGDWEHVAGVYDYARGELMIYVDGVERGAVELERSVHAETPFVIGGVFEDSDEGAWNGGVDDVHVYQGVLSKMDIGAVQFGSLPS
ncbi:LamG domain-containing protein [Nocardiopsis halophila]|uniref:LamG domain-containing protein n=1 Tax=Nocardiopsis halophila TaxID=141692 RepID=UPI001F4D1B63|nr:LamG domain-containing protein [Nocardiopsis halophila]